MWGLRQATMVVGAEARCQFSFKGAEATVGQLRGEGILGAGLNCSLLAARPARCGGLKRGSAWQLRAGREWVLAWAALTTDPCWAPSWEEEVWA